MGVVMVVVVVLTVVVVEVTVGVMMMVLVVVVSIVQDCDLVRIECSNYLHKQLLELKFFLEREAIECVIVDYQKNKFEGVIGLKTF